MASSGRRLAQSCAIVVTGLGVSRDLPEIPLQIDAAVLRKKGCEGGGNALANRLLQRVRHLTHHLSNGADLDQMLHDLAERSSSTKYQIMTQGRDIDIAESRLG